MPYRTNNNDDNKIVSAFGENFPILKLYFSLYMLFWKYGFTEPDLETTSHYLKNKSANWPSSLYQILHELGTRNTYRPVVPMVVCITQGELCIHVIYGFELVEFRPILQSSWDVVIQYIWCRWNVVQYNMILWYSIDPYIAWGRTSET